MARPERLSVVMPVRNGEQTLRRALTSTLLGLPDDAELVVVDDGSTDATAEVAARIRDPRLRFERSQGSPGVAGALNFGIEIASGHYLARMDADDICARGRFRRQLRTMATERVDLCFGSILNFSPSAPWVLPSPPVPLTSEIVPWQLLLDNVLAHPTMLCRRQVLLDLGGYRATPAEDYDLWLRAAASGCRMRRTGRFEVAYRIHPDQVSGREAWRRDVLREPELVQSMTDLAAYLDLPYPADWARGRADPYLVPESHRAANARRIEEAMPALPKLRKLRMLAGEYLPSTGSA